MARAKSLATLRRAAVEPGGGLLQRGPGLGQRRVQGEQVGLVLLERGELGLDGVAAVGQLVGRAVEPRGQPAVQGQARFDLLEPGGVVVPALAEVPQAEGDLARLVGQPLEGRRGLGQLGRRPGQRLERPRDPLQQPLRRAVGLVEQGVSLGGGRPDLVGAARADAPRGSARRTRPASGSAAASSSRSNSSSARSRRRASAESISSCRFRRNASCACRAAR